MTHNLLFSTSAELIRVPGDAVVYIKADGNYSTLRLADGGQYVLCLQLGQVERHISDYLSEDDNRFVRIGKSLIVNTEYITYISPSRKRLVLSDCRSFRHELTASHDALKILKDFIELEGQL
ncbi:MAG: LytTR family transcriptional regulator DNA-binding domain-containing protein [Duncaniella sp.]|nr:LytTR family transcriptional regulator DNA-binding domain-containing protein [Duncaniella sp.]